MNKGIEAIIRLIKAYLSIYNLTKLAFSTTLRVFIFAISKEYSYFSITYSLNIIKSSFSNTYYTIKIKY